MKLLLALLTEVVAFLLGRMLVKGATAGGITRQGEPMAYWGTIAAQSALIAFLIYILLHEPI